MERIEVMKFGSSVLPDEAALPDAVRAIYAAVRSGSKVVAVVSAMGDMTDRLIEQADRVGCDEASKAALVSTGEATSAALLSLALDQAGIPATVLDAHQMGLKTRGGLLDGEPIDLDAEGIRGTLESFRVVVVPGFVGEDPQGRIALLGRGGSDLTAVYVAGRLGAEQCVLFKDVDGLYERDPSAEDGPKPGRFESIRYDDAREVGGRVVQRKAIDWAERLKVLIRVGRINGPEGTAIGAAETALEPDPIEARPVKIGLLGLGTVGGGVCDQLARIEGVELVAAAVRDVDRHRRDRPSAPVVGSPDEVLALGCDVLVELIGGSDEAERSVRLALGEGISVVSANKALVAARMDDLLQLAATGGANLRYSAAVGGGVPMIELVDRARRAGSVVRLEGVLNGTCNYVLDRMAEGLDEHDAVREAQLAGFAEADPSMDVSGLDAAAKLSILIAHGFGQRVAVESIDRRGIEGLDPAIIEEARGSGGVVRLVARAEHAPGGIGASVRPEILPAQHPLAGVRAEGNVLLVRLEDGRELVVTGKGAGRWPTATAVLADVMDEVAALQARRGGSCPASA